MSKRILIIGAGVIGLCSAYYAVRRGHRVTIIDRAGPDDHGCSYENAGMIVPSHFTPLAAPGVFKLAMKWMGDPESPLYVKPSLAPPLLGWAWRFWRASTQGHVQRAAPVLRDLSFASLTCFQELADMPEHDFGLVRRGLLMLCKTEPALEEEAKTAAMAQALGVPANVLSPKEVAVVEPNARLAVAGAVHFPKDAHLTPERFLGCVRHQLESSGVQFKWSTQAIGFQSKHRSISRVRTSQGDIEGDEVVICGGAWSPKLGESLGVHIPIQAGKGYSVTLQHPPEVPRVCSILSEARVAVTPMEGALRVGGTMEISGLNDHVDTRRVQGILKALPNYYPAFSVKDFDGIKPWMGLRPVSPDGLPYLGRTAKWSNVLVATGHAMMGLSLGPISGRLIAELIDGEQPSIEISLLNPDRYN